MIQHVRHFNAALAALPLPAVPDTDEDDSPEIAYLTEAEAFEAEQDDSLDCLLKHAMKTASQRPDSGLAWQRLSRRVQGPFGVAALEAPALNSLEAELLASGGRIQQAPFVLNDKVTERGKRPGMETAPAIDCLWDMLRFGASGRALGGSAGVLG